MKADLFRFPFLVYLICFLVGCNPIAAPSTPEYPEQSPAETTAMTTAQTIPAEPTQGDDMQTDPSLPIPAISGLQPLINKAKADLAQRLSIPADQINIMETREVFWPDASLGCPQPGVTYAQVLTPGYLLLLEANGNKFEYHANIHNHVFYCENPAPPILETPTSVSP